MISRGTKGLAERYRPQRFSEMIGQEKLCLGIRKRWSKDKHPTALLLSGETGTGKTTLARIIALSVSCTHQSEFGEPCKACRQSKEQFDIVEVNAARERGVEDIDKIIDAYEYAPQPPALVRVYILDEMQMLSKKGQNLLLKPFEDGPDTTLWIICTTSPQGIIKTLRGRCLHWKIPPLKISDSRKLVESVVQSEVEAGRVSNGYKKESLDKFIDALNEQQVFEPRLILNNLETFLTTFDPACVTGITVDETVMLGRYVLKGDWDSVRLQLKDLDSQSIEGIRRGMIAYLRKVLLESKRSATATRLRDSIKELAEATSYDDSITSSLVVSALYSVCRRFN